MKILVSGGSGMVGSALVPELRKCPGTEVLAPRRAELNLLDAASTRHYVASHKPDLIVHLSARVGGIQANINQPVAFLFDNVAMGFNLVHAAISAEVPGFINTASSCMYPRDQEILRESDLDSFPGNLEPTNEGYAIAKISVMRLCEYAQRQYGFAYKTIIPSNLYGPHDHFDLVAAHLVPAAIRKLHDAKTRGEASVNIWGDGTVRREFMYVSDLVDFYLHAVERLKELPSRINVGLGVDYTVNDYYRMAKTVVGYTGTFTHDLSKPVGMKKKLLDVTLAKSLGWSAKVDPIDGIRSTYDSFLKSLEKVNNP